MGRYFITAKENCTLESLLKLNLPSEFDPLTIIKAGGVWENSGGRIMEPDAIVDRGTTLRVYTSPGQGKEYKIEEGDLVYENRELIVAYKPPGINVHEVPASGYFNLTHGINLYLKNCGITYKTTPVTRLDRVVEGLVIFPKSKESEKSLFRLIMDRKINKWYTAYMEKEGEPEILRVKNCIKSDGRKTKVDASGKFSDTLFIKSQDNIYSAFIFTGRRHQIRCHASDFISPIKGDTLYGGTTTKGRGIGLICRGYNIPWRGKNLRIRMDEDRIEDFFLRNGLPAS